jgi:hypothetical protein
LFKKRALCLLQKRFMAILTIIFLFFTRKGVIECCLRRRWVSLVAGSLRNTGLGSERAVKITHNTNTLGVVIISSSSIIIVTCMNDCRRGLDWWMDLLTTYTPDLQVQVITASPLISTIHKWPQHPPSPCPRWMRVRAIRTSHRINASQIFAGKLEVANVPVIDACDSVVEKWLRVRRVQFY